ncbi:unnamed protein product [Owenia fusiformis]|uniref:Uncharacterized protein n=1 Tax=Owenia fusiformis TaxID=6347 RepID=A0A8J1URE4_OWEFU|nr:unnamed protein product [Owenia fusiformis]
MSSPKKRQVVYLGSPQSETLKIETDSDHDIVLAKNSHSFKVLQGLDKLRRDELLCDYTLIADNLSIKVHKAVMVSVSDYFHAMFTGTMKESQESSVELKGVTAGGLKELVTFAYTGQLKINLDNLQEILSAAAHLQIAEAVELCCDFMSYAITTENCVDLLNLAEIYSLSGIRAKARDYMLKNFEEFSKTEQYQRLNHIQLAAMLEENSLNVAAEYKLFQHVLDWIDHDRKEREVHLPVLMQNIRLPLLSGEELVDKVSQVDIMRQNKECGDLLNAAKDYHIVVGKQPLMQSSRTQVRSAKKSLIMVHAENIESFDLETHRHIFLRDASVPLYNPCVCVVDNFMYACGGKYDGNENNEIATARCFRYDPRFDSWFELASMNESRKDFSMVAHGKQLYAISGQDENMVMCTVECFLIEKNDWESRQGLASAVYGHASAICNNLIYVSGGQKFDGYTNSVSCYDPNTDHWSECPPLKGARANHIMEEIMDKLYVIGGNTEDSYGFPVPTVQIEMYDPKIEQWTLCKSSINIRDAGSAVMSNKIYVIGGINGGHYYSDLIQVFDPRKDDVNCEERFSNQIYGRACCVLTLPQYDYSPYTQMSSALHP